MHVRLRLRANKDTDFLRALYATVRAEEMAVVPWPEAVKAAFLRQQFDAQDLCYTSSYPGARQWIIIRDTGATRRPVGRFFLYCGVNDWRIIDIAFLPEWRGMGMGSGLITATAADAAAAGCTLSLHVDIHNRAKSLYRRLGFVEDGAHNGLYQKMVRALP